MEDFSHTVRNLDFKEALSSTLHEWEYARSQANYYLSVMRKTGISPEGKKILEVGCGHGFFLVYGIKVLRWNLYGIEPGKGEYRGRFEMARRLLSENDIDPERVINSAGESIKLDSNSFDVIISNNVLEHVVDPQKVIQEGYRVLTPGGLLVFNMPNYRWFYEGHYDMFWFPFIICKPVARRYMRLRGRDPGYIGRLNFLAPWKIKKMVKNISGAKIYLPLEFLSTESMLERVKARIERMEKTKEGEDGRTYILKFLYAIASTEPFKWLMGLWAGLTGMHYEIHLTIKKENRVAGTFCKNVVDDIDVGNTLDNPPGAEKGQRQTLRFAQGDILQLISLCSDNGAEEKVYGRCVTTHPKNWQEIIETARREGISIPLYKGLKDSNGLLPQEYREELRREYFSTLVRNKYYFRELVRCLEAMDVPVILLKGAALLPAVYNDLGARHLGDFDILIQRKDLEKVKGCLGNLGYEFRGGDGPYVNRISFLRRGEPVLPLEVHWHIENAMFPNFEMFRMERMWQAALPVKIEDYQGLIFAPHHQLLHLSVHALKHSYDRLTLLWDIHQVINCYGERLNWEELIKEALEFRLSRPLFYGLYLTKLLMNTDVPEHVLNRLKPLSLGIEERIFVYLINRGIRKPGLQYLVYFPMNQGIINKLRFLGRALFPPRDILSEMEALDDSEIGAAHYLRCISRRFKWSCGLMGTNNGR